jgi:hypothetical protein
VKRILLAFVFLLVPGLALAQTESLTLTVNNSSVPFNSDGTAAQPLSLTLTWSVSGSAGEHLWIVYPYFATSAALTGFHGHTIPASAFHVSIDGGIASPCDGAGIYGAYSNPISSISTNCPALFYRNDSSLTFPTIPLSGSQTSTVTPSIVGTFNADNYLGTLSFIASVQ